MNTTTRLLLAGLLLVLAGQARAQVNLPESLGQGLLAYYSFDEEDAGQDASGNGWDGLIGGYSLATGLVGKAVAFDGTGGMIIDTFRNYAWGESLSVSLWVMRLDEKGYIPLIGNGLNNDSSWSLQGGGESAGRAMWAIVETGKPNLNYDFPPGLAEIGKWHHLVLIYSGNTVYFFVDGSPLLPLQSDAGPIRVMDTPLQVGCVNFNGSWRRARMLADEIRIYNRALSVQEVNLLGIDTLNASSVPDAERGPVRRVSAGLRIAGATTPVVAPRPPVTPNPVTPPPVTPAVEPPSGQGMTPASAPRGSDKPVATEAVKSTWWTEAKSSGLSSTTDCCTAYQTWLELWSKGEKQAVIDDLNRLAH